MNSIVLDIPEGRDIQVMCLVTTMIPIKSKYGFSEKAETIHRAFKLDTGSSITCFNADDFKIQVNEYGFGKMHKGIELIGTGIDETSQIIYYPMQVENFVVAGLDLGSVPIYITIDSRAHKRLLGMDILRLMDVDLRFSDKELTLSKTIQFVQFKKNKFRLEISDMFKLGIYSKNDYKNSIDWQNILACKDLLEL